MVSQIKVNEIIKQSGSSITIGESGDTINLAGSAYAEAGTNTPAFLATCESTQTISHNVFTKIQFAVEKFDSDGTYDNATNYRWTPGVVGKYVIGFAGWFYDANDALSSVVFSIYKNGSAYASEQHYEIDGSSNTNGSASFHIGRVLDLDDDDYIEMYLNADVSSGSPSVQGGTGTGNSTYFGAYRLIT